MVARPADGIAPTAARSTVLGTRFLLALAGLFAIAASAKAFDLSNQARIPWLHYAAAAFAFLAGTALLWSGLERASREGRRRRYILLFVAGMSIWLFGQALGYLLLASGDTFFDPRIEAIPLVLGSPLMIIGAIGLTRPAHMDRQDLLDAAVDATLGAISLVFIWALAVLPLWAPPLDPGLQWVASLDQVLLLLAAIAVMIIISFSRRPGSLPLAQLLLFMGGLAVVVVSDLLGEFGPDRRTEVTISVLGYWLGVALLVAMLHHPAAEVESVRAEPVRLALAVGVPYSTMLIAGLLLMRALNEAIPKSGILVILPVIWAVAVFTLAITRASDQHSKRTRRHARSTSALSASAEFGWIGALLKDSSEYVFVVDSHGSVVYASPRCQQRLAAAQDFADLLLEPHGADFATLMSAVLAGAASPGPYEMLLRGADGSEREVEIHLRTVREVSFEGFVVTGTDMTDTRRLVRQLDLTHRHDELTGLLTHDAFVAELVDALEGDHPVGVAVLDISDLGVWNETLGREGGDAILQAVGRRLTVMPAEVAAVGRISGDAFGLLVPNPAPDQIIEAVLEQLTASLRGLLLPDDTEVDVSFCAGYAVWAVGGRIPAQELLDQADVALRRARSSRHSRVVCFIPGMNDALVRRLSSEQAIREALGNDRVEVHYQPIITLEDESVHTMEALVRLRTADGDLLMPGDFIEAAEYSGLIRELDERVRHIVARDWPTLAASCLTDLRINVNVHEMELNEDLISDLLARDLAHRMVLEVTEASLLTRPHETVAALQTWRAAGGLVAIDDFGTGYSSLSQILALPCDVLKLDRSFLASMGESPRTMSLVRATVQLAHDLGLSTVAEGVETSDDVVALRAMGCDRAQGFRYTRALPLEEILHWLRDR